MKTSTSHQRGTVLVTTLVLALLVGIVVSALLIISQQHNTLTSRSQTWCGEIPIAEAGIEEAMAHLNSRPATLATNGWEPNGSNVVKKRELGDGYYYTAISTQLVMPTIVSIGFGRIPLQTNFTRRVVTATARQGFVWGFIGINGVEMSGTTAYIDSFDSSDPRYSSNRLYSFSKRRDMVGVATLSSARPALNTGTARIFGYVATAPGGTVAGTVGDGSWCSDPTRTGIQSGHSFDDFNMAIPSVSVPADLKVASAPSPGTVGGTNYAFVLGSSLRSSNYAILDDLSLPESTGGLVGGLLTGLLGKSGNMIVTGHANLYISGKFSIGGQGKVIITTNGSLTLYLGGDGSLSGHGFFNENGVATTCTVYGLPSCKSIKYGGGADWISRIYAPQAAVEIGGGAYFAGSIIGLTLKFSGTPELHYDEALGGSSPLYKIIAWEEL